MLVEIFSVFHDWCVPSAVIPPRNLLSLQESDGDDDGDAQWEPKKRKVLVCFCLYC